MQDNKRQRDAIGDPLPSPKMSKNTKFSLNFDQIPSILHETLLPIFDGNPENATTFLSDLEGVTYPIEGTTDQHALRQGTNGYLHAAHMDWYKKNEHFFTSWNVFKGLFLDRFGLTPFQCKEMIDRIHQGEVESVYLYVIRVFRIWLRVKRFVPDAIMASCFVRGATDYTRRLMEKLDFLDYGFADIHRRILADALKPIPLFIFEDDFCLPEAD